MGEKNPEDNSADRWQQWNNWDEWKTNKSKKQESDKYIKNEISIDRTELVMEKTKEGLLIYNKNKTNQWMVIDNPAELKR